LATAKGLVIHLDPAFAFAFGLSMAREARLACGPGGFIAGRDVRACPVLDTGAAFFWLL
jgi:hypothetical protein